MIQERRKEGEAGYCGRGRRCAQRTEDAGDIMETASAGE